MKRILILNYELPPLGGGGGVASFKLAKGYIQNGYQVDYLTTWYKGLKKFEVVDGVNVYRVKVLGRNSLPTASMLSMLCYPFAGLWRGIRLCRENKYEFINTHFVIPTGPLGFALSNLFGIKNILTIIGGDIYDPTKKSSPHRHLILKLIVRFFIQKANRVVAISLNTKENAIKYHGVTKKIEVISIPFTAVRYPEIHKSKLGLSGNKKYIIGVGRLIKRKNFEFFLNILAMLPDNVCGIIVGDGPERYNLEGVAHKLNISRRVIFTGYVDEQIKFQYLANSDIFFLSSIHEGFGIVLQEAMQTGLPIVAVNNGGQTDIVNEGENGFLMGSDKVADLASKIVELLQNKKLAQTISNNNREKIAMFEPGAIAAKYLNGY